MMIFRPMKILSLCLVFASSVLAVEEYTDDPYLAFRPAFARSLPVQILLTGIVLTLTVVLFMHLLFTAQYHWPLAPLNYVLQLSGVTTLLISLIATIHVVLSATLAESVKWPYMLSYIAVNVPPLNLDTPDSEWSLAERTTWLLMTASTSGLIQLTHIQFLTLLYPSKLEGRLIFTLLGPLAIVAAVMQLLPISNSPQVCNIASVVRNICNATLSLLFTAALFVWGFLVNRQQAWRTDGGTAIFGVAALVLAVVSTALNFLYVHKEEEFVWLPTLVCAVVLWQSFLGWWWWVGAGSGGGLTGQADEVEEKLRRRAKREGRKKEARERKEQRRINAHRVWQGVAGAFMPPAAASTTAVEVGPSQSTELSMSSEERDFRRRTSVHGSEEEEEEEEEDEEGNLTADSASGRSRASSITLTGRVTSCSTTTTTAPRFIPDVVFRLYNNLRIAHNDAARLQAVEREERIRSMGRERRVEGDEAALPGRIWDAGLSFPWRNNRRRDESVDGEMIDLEETFYGRREREGRRRTEEMEPAVSSSRSFWWWGPLGRWRLQDSTTY